MVHQEIVFLIGKHCNTEKIPIRESISRFEQEDLGPGNIYVADFQTNFLMQELDLKKVITENMVDFLIVYYLQGNLGLTYFFYEVFLADLRQLEQTHQIKVYETSEEIEAFMRAKEEGNLGLKKYVAPKPEPSYT